MIRLGRLGDGADEFMLETAGVPEKLLTVPDWAADPSCLRIQLRHTTATVRLLFMDRDSRGFRVLDAAHEIMQGIGDLFAPRSFPRDCDLWAVSDTATTPLAILVVYSNSQEVIS